MYEVDLKAASDQDMRTASEHLRRDGLILARRAVPTGSVRSFRRQLADHMAGAGTRNGTAVDAVTEAAADAVTWARLRRGVTPEQLHRLRGAAYHCPQYHRLFRSPCLLGLLRQLQGADMLLLHPQRQPHTPDDPHVPADPDLLTVRVPLHDSAGADPSSPPHPHVRLGDVLVFHSRTRTPHNPGALHHMTIDGTYHRRPGSFPFVGKLVHSQT